jgi:fructoselysine-6-P-deglycase FrlB-like protein
MLTDTTLVVGLFSGDQRAYEVAVLEEAHQLSARILALGDAAPPTPIGGGHAVGFGSGLDEIAYSLLYLPPLQLMALARALAKGLHPDRPHNLDAVVHL